MVTGRLVLVVGPSGAGKDSLIGEARRLLARDERFVFVRRVVTRQAVIENEDHDTLDVEQFDLRRRCGGFALHWEAHGLSYGLPAAPVDSALMVGRVVVANVSRAVVGLAMQKYAHCHVIMITASPDVLGERLAGRGRETGSDVVARLGRAGTPLPVGVFPAIIENSGTLEDGARRFVRELTRIAG